MQACLPRALLVFTFTDFFYKKDQCSTLTCNNWNIKTQKENSATSLAYKRWEEYVWANFHICQLLLSLLLVSIKYNLKQLCNTYELL